MKKVKSKRVVSMLVALSLLSALAGCGEAKPETPAEITDAMHTAMTATPCTSMKMDFVLDMSVSSEETGTMLLGMDMSSEGTVSSDPVASHSVVTTLLDLEGQPVETTAETYTVVEDDTLVTYALTSGIWTRVETGVAVDALTAASAIELDSANVSIDEAVTEWNGIPAVCLVTTMSGAEMQDILGTVIQSVGGSTAEGIDLSAIRCDARIYLDEETWLPMAEEIEISGMGEVMAATLGQAGAEVEVTTCTAMLQFVSYEAQEAIVLPEGTADKAAKWERLLAENPDNGDGTYTIREGMAIVDVKIPEGFEVVDATYDQVIVNQPSIAREITYTMTYLQGGGGSTEAYDAYFAKNAQFYVDLSGQLQTKCEREQMEIQSDTLPYTCDLLSMTYDSGAGRTEAEFYAWSPIIIGEDEAYYLLVNVNDGYVTGLEGDVRKDADITPEEFVSYLSAASTSDLIDN